MVNVDATLRGLLACVCDGLTLPACTCCAVAGAPVADRCCEGDGGCVGQLTANVVDTYEVEPQTLTRRVSVRPCRPASIAADINLVVARCHPTQDEQGNPPECPELDAAATQTHVDIADMWRLLSCCPDFKLTIRSVGVDPGDPFGGCVAVVAQVTVLLDEVV